MRRKKNKRKLQEMEEDEDAEKECTCDRHEEFAGEDVPRLQPVTNFHRHWGQADGRSPYCKPCRNELQKLREKQYKKRNRKRRKMIPEGTKTCSRCKEELPYTQFYRKSYAKSGFHSWCKACHDAKK